MGGVFTADDDDEPSLAARVATFVDTFVETFPGFGRWTAPRPAETTPVAGTMSVGRAEGVRAVAVA
tara:strand:- start:3000 stop:3197 length:198 start_codon:yes stop_codon:yes gene_type:complete